MENLVVAGILAEVRPSEHLIASGELEQLLRHFEAVAGQGFEKFVADLWHVEIAHHDKVVASSRSPNSVSACRGVGSWMSFAQRASPSSSGIKCGSDSASLARFSGPSFSIADSISSTVVMAHAYRHARA